VWQDKSAALVAIDAVRNAMEHVTSVVSLMTEIHEESMLLLKSYLDSRASTCHLHAVNWRNHVETLKQECEGFVDTCLLSLNPHWE
jgi:hypothetical protein